MPLQNNDDNKVARKGNGIAPEKIVAPKIKSIVKPPFIIPIQVTDKSLSTKEITDSPENVTQRDNLLEDMSENFDINTDDQGNDVTKVGGSF